MITRKQSNGELLLIGQTDHSRLVGQLAAHWGNSEFTRPEPYDSVVRAAAYHDYGWLRYETSPLADPKSGEPYGFREVPFNQAQLDSYQQCIDWLSAIDRYSGLLVGMHRTGLWKGRYQTIAYPASKYNPKGTRPEIEELVNRSEAWQKNERSAIGEETIWVNYHLLQVWDLLGLYFCCQDPYDEYIEPVPMSYIDKNKSVRMTTKPIGAGHVTFEPYPFDVRPLRVQIMCKRLPKASFPDEQAFRTAYFQAENELLQYELT